MRTWKKRLAALMAALMLVSALPVSALAAEPESEEPQIEASAPLEEAEPADEVIYNLQDMEITVGSDTERAEDGREPYVLFEADGSYTIELEADAFFPYEVQFTYQGSTWSEWFMDPEDTVSIGGHTFSVESYQTDPTALNQIGVWIGGQYVPAYPEAKEFTNDGPGISLLSMMPLTEKTAYLDMTGYLPDELKEVSLEAITESLTNYSGSNSVAVDGDVAVWAKWSYYDENGNSVGQNDDYTIVEKGSTIDLSNYSSSDTSLTLELIVGTADQLNLNNVRYIVTVRVSAYGELLEFTAATENDTPIDVYDAYLWESSRYGNIYEISVDKEDWAYGDTAKLKIALSDKYTGLTPTVYEGYYETEDAIPANAKEITADMVNGAGYLGDYNYQNGYQNMPQVTVVLKRGDKTVMVLPATLYMYEAGLSLSGSFGVYAESQNSASTSRTSITYSSDSDYSNGYTYRTVMLEDGYAPNETYYYNLTMHNPDTAADGGTCGINYVKKAVVGYYEDADSIPETVPDIKGQLFSSAYSSSGGYGTDYSNGVTFTVIDTKGGIHWYGLKTVEYEKEEEEEGELPSAPTPASEDTYFRMRGADKTDGTSIRSYVMPYDADSYYYNGYQTVFLLNSDGSAVANNTDILPTFYTGNRVEMFAGNDVDGTQTSAVKQISGETEVTFKSGEVIQYSAAAENGANLKNYWVTFLTQQSGGPKLFVNAANDESRWVTVTDENGNVSQIPQREVFLTDEYDNHHDVFFANIGSEDMEGLYVRLEGAQNVALDDYWTIGETTTLSAFTTTVKKDASGSRVSYGELANVAKIRLVPETDANGNILAGEISGTLVIGYGNAENGTGEEVRIQLTGVAGTPKITTTSVVDGVKYVPYSSVIQTNNMYASDAVQFELTGGALPGGMEVKPNGEVYGVPTDSGEFTFTVTAVYNGDETLSDSREFTLTILDNTDENVENATDAGYALLDRVEEQMSSYEDQVFRSEGEYAQFVDFWLDGVKLTDGEDYISEEGSTKITIQAQTFRNAGSGTHTIAAEFRTGGATQLDSTLKRTAQNYNSTVSSGGGTTYYSVSAAKPANGTITVTPTNAAKGKTVTVTVQPDQGYQLSTLTVTDSTGAKVALSGGNGTYTFVMPAGRVSVQGSFTLVELPDERMPFVDVKKSDWFSDAVNFAYENGLMTGTSATTFAPNTTTSRGMIVTILYQMEGKPESANSYFADVPINQYYAKAASWAAEQGIVSGYGDGKFGPDDPITREQIVMILMKYVAYKQDDTSKRGDLSSFSDCGLMDESAAEAMSWAVAEGLICGKGGGILDPKGPATRAEVAAILTQFTSLLQE